MRFFSKSVLMAMATGGVVLSSCSHETDYYDPAVAESDRKAEYDSNFKSLFGEVSSEQDWNMAAKVRANVSLAGIDGASVVSVYTAMPGGKNCRLAAEFPAEREAFEFDYPESLSSAYVTVKDSKDRILFGSYFAISEGQINIAKSVRGTRGDCPTALGEQIVSESYLQDYNGQWDSGYYPTQWNPWVKYTDVFDFYRLSNVAVETGSSIKISDMVDIVGEGGVFAERGLDADGKCNLMHWEEQLKPSEGAEYVMESDGPMEITFMYGGTQKLNKLGYLYYKDGASEQEILSAPRYILMEDATPQNNVKVDGTAVDGGMKLPSIVEGYQKYGQADATLTGTTYKLAYFGEDGKGSSSFTFPAGTHIVFFEIIDGMNKKDAAGQEDPDQFFTAIRYSLPWMNKYFYYKRYEGHPSYQEYDAAELFVTYKWNGQTILGMEDEGGDDDMNDILFLVNGEFKSADIPDIGNDPAPQSWILACEDLGGDDDFDFNDVVFKVSHVAGKTTATVTPMAAGGTLPATIWCKAAADSPQRMGEVHDMFGVETSKMVNTNAADGVNGIEGATATVTVPENYTMTADMGGFWIVIEKDGVGEITVNAPGKGSAPQMLCIPEAWKWPTERTRIDNAYPGFGEWGANFSNGTWYLNYTAGLVY